MFGLGAGEVLIILVIAFLLFGPKQLPEVGRQVGRAVKGFKDTAEDLRKSVEPEINMIQQEVKMVEQDFQASMKEAEDEINARDQQAEQQSDQSNPDRLSRPNTHIPKGGDGLKRATESTDRI